MRKIYLSIATAMFFLIACQKSGKPVQEEQELSYKNRTCASDEVLRLQLAADPTLRKRMQDIETFTKKAIANREDDEKFSRGNGYSRCCACSL
jgi:hypothetical protein